MNFIDTKIEIYNWIYRSFRGFFIDTIMSYSSHKVNSLDMKNSDWF